MRQNRHSTKMYVVHRNTLSDSFRIRIIWFQPKQDSDRIRISFFKNKIRSDSKNPLSDHLWYLPVARDGVLTYGESKSALKYSNDKAMPSGFSHFFATEWFFHLKKFLKVFFKISGRLIAARWSPTAKNIVNGPLVHPQRPTQNLAL